MSDLRLGAHPRELVPGVPEDCEALAARLSTYSDDARESATRLDAIDSGAWVGAAGDAFREAIGELPIRLRRASDAFWDAAAALRTYADRLRDAQAAAARALELFAEADTRSRSCAGQQQAYEEALRSSLAGGSPPPDSPPPTADPGEERRLEAERLLDQARQDVDDAARRASDRLEEAGRAAPNKPGWLKRTLSGTANFAGDFVGGVVEGTVGMVTFGFKLSPTYALIDPEGYVENITAMATGIAYGVAHPVEFAKAAVNWEMWLDNPGRALGQLVPELALTAATAGIGGAAAKGSGVSRRLAGSADEFADVGRAARKGAITGARGPVSGRKFDPQAAGGRIRSLNASRARINTRGTDVVEAHLRRFAEGAELAPPEKAMLQRLRSISKGELQPTIYDQRFYTHELREMVRYRRLGYRTGQPPGDPGYEMWNNAHTATLEDYGISDADLFQPGVR